MKKCSCCDYCKIILKDRIISSEYKKYYCHKKDKLVKLNEICPDYTPAKKQFDLSDARFEQVIEEIHFLMDYFKDKE